MYVHLPERKEDVCVYDWEEGNETGYNVLLKHQTPIICF